MKGRGAEAPLSCGPLIWFCEGLLMKAKIWKGLSVFGVFPIFIMVGCTSKPVLTELRIKTIYKDDAINKEVVVNDAVCKVHIGGDVRDVTTPAVLNLNLKRNDKLYVYCSKPGFQMWDSFGAAQLTESLAYEKIHYNACDSVGVAGLGVAFVGAPIALLTANSNWLAAPLVFGGLLFTGRMIAQIPYSNGYQYPSNYVGIYLYPNDYKGKEKPRPVNYQPESAKYWKRSGCSLFVP